MTAAPSTKSGTIAAWLRDRVAAARAKGLVVGLSGGIDSAVVVRLCQLAVPGRVIGAILPCHSDPQDEADAALVATYFGVPTIRVDLAPAYDRVIASTQMALEALAPDVAATTGAETVDLKARVPVANAKPRLSRRRHRQSQRAHHRILHQVRRRRRRPIADRSSAEE
jgi:NH3-dependent NAD+ synthetase